MAVLSVWKILNFDIEQYIYPVIFWWIVNLALLCKDKDTGTINYCSCQLATIDKSQNAT